MASNINTINIDTAFPVAGQDNDSQGFRDNFFNTNENFKEAKLEIEALQAASGGNYVFDTAQIPDNSTDNWVLTYDHNGGVNSEIRLAPVPASDETTSGIIQLATQAEVNAGLDIIKAITPATLASWSGGFTSPLTTKGDLYIFSTVDARLAVGTDDFVLTADSTAPEGVAWKAVVAGGSQTPWTSNIDAAGFSLITQPTASGTANDINITPGSATYDGSGGNVNITAGGGGTEGSYDGAGSVFIIGGLDGYNGNLGSRINVLNATDFAGGGISLRAGTTSSGTPDNIDIFGGANTSATGAGGAVVLTGGPGISNVNPGGSIIIKGGLNTGSGGNGTIQLIGEVEARNLNGNAGSIGLFNGAVTFKSILRADTNLLSDSNFVLPPDNGTAGFILTTDGTGITTWAAGGGGGIANVVEDLTPELGGDLNVTGGKIFTPQTESGQPTDVVIEAGFANTSGTGGNVLITAGGANGLFTAPGFITLTPGENGPLQGSVIIAGSGGTDNGTLHIAESTTGFRTEITVPTLAADTQFTLPPNNGTNGFVLTTDGAGVTTWVASGASDNWLIANNGVNFTTAPIATGAYSLAMGDGATTGAVTDAIAIGKGSSNISTGGITIGAGAVTTIVTSQTRSVVIGNASSSSATRSIVLGSNSSITGSNYQTAVGNYISPSSTTSNGIGSTKLGYGFSGANKNLLHVYDKGKVELYGSEAMFVAPTYLLASLPPQVAGGMIFVSDATGGGALTGSQCFSNGTVWIDVTTGIAVA